MITLAEFYARLGGSREEVLKRIPTEKMILKFVNMYKADPSYGQLTAAVKVEDWQSAFRAAHAFGIDAVLVTPSCHDPLFRRASRTSQGTVLQVPWTRIGTQRQWAAEGIPLLHAAGFKVAALALEDRSLALGDPQLAACERLAMVLGTEGAGLFPSTIAACDYTVKIPMAHGVDSLNVAAASAVAFWELRAR